jgi:hypothetical protein
MNEYTGLESIDFQSDITIVKDIEKSIKELREIISDNELLINDYASPLLKGSSEKIAGLIRKRFNLKKLNVYFNNRHNASAHTLSNDNVTEKFGTLNKKTSVVGGWFSEIPVIISIGMSLLLDKYLSDKHITAIIFHELGHVVDGLSTLTVIYDHTGSLTELTKVFTKVKTFEERVSSVKKIDPVFYNDLTEKDLKTFVNLSQNDMAAFYINDKMSLGVSQTGSKSYEKKRLEQSADAFAARFGLSVELAEALKIIYNTIDPPNDNGFVLCLKLMTYTPLTILSSGIKSLLFLTFNDGSIGDNISYDSYYNRVDKFGQQILVQLKNKNISKNERILLLADYEVIKDILNNYKETKNYFSIFNKVINREYRKEIRRSEFLYGLERLGNNKLFAASAKIKSLI